MELITNLAYNETTHILGFTNFQLNQAQELVESAQFLDEGVRYRFRNPNQANANHLFVEHADGFYELRDNNGGLIERTYTKVYCLVHEGSYYKVSHDRAEELLVPVPRNQQ